MPTWLLSPWGYVIAAGLSAVIAGAGIGWTVHKVDSAFYDDLVIKDKDAQLAAVQIAAMRQKDADALAQKAAVDEAKAQQQLADANNKIIQKVPVYVKDSSTCITYGLVRVLDAAVLGSDPASLGLPTGKSNDACAPVKNTDLAISVVGNYGAARQNAEQLTGLQQYERDRQVILDQPPASQPTWFERNFGKL